MMLYSKVLKYDIGRLQIIFLKNKGKNAFALLLPFNKQIYLFYCLRVLPDSQLCSTRLPTTKLSQELSYQNLFFIRHIPQSHPKQRFSRMRNYSLLFHWGTHELNSSIICSKSLLNLFQNKISSKFFLVEFKKLYSLPLLDMQ